LDNIFGEEYIIEEWEEWKYEYSSNDATS
jgi:hypothetical protein